MNEPYTICAKCNNAVPEGFTGSFWRCKAGENDVLNMVTGNFDKERAFCMTKNHVGSCQDYKEKQNDSTKKA